MAGDHPARLADEQVIRDHADDDAIVLRDVYLAVEFDGGRVVAPGPEVADDLGHLGQVRRGRIAEVEVLERRRVRGDSRTEDHLTTVIECLVLPLGFHGSRPETSGLVRR